ncbi:Uncaracterized surface protein containing fasciclin (FAS1) repeats [Hymenobacter daecheongensis DSM 21074]|uniref:Uncaracterized surface protein containing fasciclin (FAS1) repeats n=1 Tax=Hymenobacter daecheongensis DSM 21074 TaxID=1121955 RepID=A0A1M6KLT8_9BACT|nr:fasciclin domain-containing protein [Hymenobacter daecheongensis]SHJ59968.1 Uncaracterized surface protein containing fasciclin (FAS1) repeats [Hymenobacter daecheongensis DSM 21074]
MKYLVPKWFAGLAVTSLLLAGCEKSQEPDQSIAGITVANPDFQQLEDAAIRGGVVAVLSNKNPSDPQGNYTVFAPNNAAFARLGLRTALDLTALYQPFLTQTLLYHVAGGTLAGSALQPGTVSASAFGPTRRFVSRGGNQYVNGSRIIATDVRASNGTIHAVDKVLLATGADVVQSAVALSTAKVFVQPELTYLVAALQLCGLTGALTKSPGSPQFTVFAPTDQAFRNLGQQLGLQLDKPADVSKIADKIGLSTLSAVLTNHVLIGDKFTSELPEKTALPSFGGAPATTGPFTDGLLTVKGNGNATPANMVIPDVQCTNGIVHVIDQVLLP